MTDPIDYSRPVGWWCPVCCTADGYVGRLIRRKPRERKQKHYCLDDEGNRLRKTPIASCIPRYLPIPKGQRPPAASEVDDAEVVTSYSAPSSSTPFTVVRSGNRADTVLEGMDIAATVQRIVTGATE